MPNSLIFFVSFVLVQLLSEVSAGDWVIGYGSLMSVNYFPNGKDKFVPVRISGMTRAWDSPGLFAVGQGAGLINLAYQENSIFLGAFESNSTLNGVAHNVDPAELAALDVRQLSSGVYVRSQLPLERVNVLYGEPQFQVNDNLWIYLLNSSYASMLTTPSSSALITQSYLDIVMTACLAIDQKYVNSMGNYSFSQEFMNTTVGWDANYWVNDRVLPRRPWTYQSNVAQIDKVLLNYLGATTLDKIQLDDPSVNDTNLKLMVQYGNQLTALEADDNATKAELTHVHEELDWHAGNFSAFKANTTAEIAHVHEELDWLAGNFSEYKTNTSAELTHVHEEIDAQVANYTAFKASTLAEFTNVKSSQAQMKSDLKREIDLLQERLRIMEEDYKGLLITWIVSIIVIALVLIGIIFFLWKKNHQPESSESIPLRPARGYSYT